jgi:hypothetical protein
MKVQTKTLFFSLLLLCTVSASCDKEETPEPVPEAGEFNLTAPTDKSTGVSVTPAFTWDESSDASSYALVISTSSDFVNPFIDVNELTANTYTPSILLATGTRYFWKVTAFNANGAKIATNAGISFRTQATAPVPSPNISKYYVSPDGEDNPDKGTIANPFKTLAYAASRVPASEGDTIYLKPGTYVETEPAVIPLGVSVIGSGELTTTLSSSGVKLRSGISPTANNYKLWYDGSLIQLVSPHRTVFRNNNSSAIAPANGNQTISGFTIDGNNKSLKAGVWVENRDNVTMHHVTFKNLAQRGAVFGPGDKDFYVYPEFYMKNTLIHDCTFINSGKDLADETLGNLCIAQLENAEIYNINITDNQGYGIKFIYDGYFKNIKIHDCTITLNESDAKWGEDIAIELWNLGPGNEVYNIQCNTWLSLVNHPEKFASPNGTENMKVYHVSIIDKDGVSGKEAVEIGAPGIEIYNSYFQDKGFGIAIWDMGRKNITIRNNIFYNTTVKSNWTGGVAVYIDNSREWKFSNINIDNNVFDTHNYGVRIKNSNAGIEGVHVRNNAFLDIVLMELALDGNNITDIVLNSNLKFNITALPWAFSAGISESSNVLGDPGFSRTGDRWDTYYKPLSGSSYVIDKGIDVGIDFNGAAPDIGRFEF